MKTKRASSRKAAAVGVIYFVRDVETGLIKIGFTSQKIEDRVRQFDGQSPVRREYEVLATVEARRRDEPIVHAYFEKARVSPSQEWFRPTGEVMEYIEGVKEKGKLIQPARFKGHPRPKFDPKRYGDIPFGGGGGIAFQGIFLLEDFCWTFGITAEEWLDMASKGMPYRWYGPQVFVSGAEFCDWLENLPQNQERKRAAPSTGGPR